MARTASKAAKGNAVGATATHEEAVEPGHSPGVERRALRMHPRILWDIITKQAGTKEKAILEAVQNSCDAGASRIDISIDAKSFSIRDDGKGFKDRQEVEDFFETFGFPHEEGDAKYGRYRMGRGQLFSFGVNDWRSNAFRMTVDLKPQGPSVRSDKADDTLGYDLRTLDEVEPGCSVSVRLYDPLMPGELHRAEKGIEEFVRFVDIPVRVNGKVVNVAPKDRKWSRETDDAYFHFTDKSTLRVYNMGVLVRDYPSHNYGGVGGIVVSKGKLDVNFARNDVVSSCPVWRRVQSTVRQEAGIVRKRKAKLTDVDVESLATEILSCELPWDQALDAKVLTDVTGAHVALSKLMTARFDGKIIAVPQGDLRGDKAMQAKAAFVLSDVTLARFGVKSTRELVDVLVDALERVRPHEGRAPGKGAPKSAGRDLDPDVEAARHQGYKPENAKRNVYDVGRIMVVLRHLVHVTDADLSALYSMEHEVIPDATLSKFDRVARDALQEAADALHKAVWPTEWVSGKGYVPVRADVPIPKRRRIFVGESETMEAWTDGSEYICVERAQLKQLTRGNTGWTRLAALLLHEYAHGEPDTGTHVHDREFYKFVHDAVIDTDAIGKAVTAIEVRLYQEARRGKDALRRDDRLETIRRAGLEVPSAIAGGEGDKDMDLAACPSGPS